MKVLLEIQISIVLSSLSTQSVAKVAEDIFLFAAMAGTKHSYLKPPFFRKSIFFLVNQV